MCGLHGNGRGVVLLPALCAAADSQPGTRERIKNQKKKASSLVLSLVRCTFCNYFTSFWRLVCLSCQPLNSLDSLTILPVQMETRDMLHNMKFLRSSRLQKDNSTDSFFVIAPSPLPADCVRPPMTITPTHTPLSYSSINTSLPSPITPTPPGRSQTPQTGHLTRPHRGIASGSPLDWP